MKKLKMDLNGIGELLNKEQMKMITGGDDYQLYITCEFPNGAEPRFTRGYYVWNSPEITNCFDYCFGLVYNDDWVSDGQGCHTYVM